MSNHCIQNFDPRSNAFSCMWCAETLAFSKDSVSLASCGKNVIRSGVQLHRPSEKMCTVPLGLFSSPQPPISVYILIVVFTSNNMSGLTFIRSFVALFRFAMLFCISIVVVNPNPKSSDQARWAPDPIHLVASIVPTYMNRQN